MLRPAPICPTIMPTVTRIPRMQGFPPIRPGSWVIRLRSGMVVSLRFRRGHRIPLPEADFVAGAVGRFAGKSSRPAHDLLEHPRDPRDPTPAEAAGMGHLPQRRSDVSKVLIT